MNNPLTQEQIDKINEIAKLPAEQQKNKLQEFLKTLNEEQIEFLRSQQKPAKCIFCAIVNNEIESFKIYEDDAVLAVLDINPASKGHSFVIPKNHYRFLTYIEDLESIFGVVKLVAEKLYESYKADTNILINNGFAAGQKMDHFSINVIPRYEKDKINFSWKPAEISKEDLGKIAKELKVEAKKSKEVYKEPEKEEYPDFEEDELVP